MHRPQGRFFVDLCALLWHSYMYKGIYMNSDDPDGNSMSRQINRRAQSALINHEKCKYNDLCILFMDGLCLWRDGTIQVGNTKYHMSRLTKSLVRRKYQKIYGKDNELLRVGLRYLLMTSTILGLIWIGMIFGARKSQPQDRTPPAPAIRYEQAQSRSR